MVTKRSPFSQSLRTFFFTLKREWFFYILGVILVILLGAPLPCISLNPAPTGEEGLVEISKTLVMIKGLENSKDRDKVLTKLPAEDHAIFGEAAFFEQSERTATVIGLTEWLLL